MKDKPLVAIHCLVYNHEPYLRDCLDGFVMQQTNFPFVVIVHDDASTDGSAAIIREYEEKYPDIIKPIYEKENQWRKGTLTKVMNVAIEATGAKYVAMCEGDDYWTDPLKLQKQVDFLENHSEYDMVCARFNHLVHETGEIEEFDLYDKIISSNAEGIEIKQEHFVSFAQPHTCTSMYRKGTLQDHPVIPKLKYRFDIPLCYCFLYNHRCWLMNEKVAIYRKHAGSITVSGETENWSLVASHKELLSHFPNDPNLKQLVQQDYRKYIIKESNKKDYTIKQFILHLSEYIKHRPKLRNIISLVVKIIKIRIKLHKNHE
jgi:glycosyltransferase involved in cell wall biosynthesis